MVPPGELARGGTLPPPHDARPARWRGRCPTRASAVATWRGRASRPIVDGSRREGANIMGKYFLAWLLGVPALVLLLIYLFFN
jgi:hypothetical protein